MVEPSVPSPVKIAVDSSVEMDWKTFGGVHHEIYYALLKQRCHRDALGTSVETLATQFRLHLHRGISYLSANRQIQNIVGLFLRLNDGVGKLSGKSTLE